MPFPPHWLSHPLPSLSLCLHHRPHTDTITRFGWARNFKIDSAYEKCPGPTKEILIPGFLDDMQICVLNRLLGDSHVGGTIPILVKNCSVILCYIHVRNRLTSKHMTCIATSRKIFWGDYFVSLMKLSMVFECLNIGSVLDLRRGKQNCV